MPDLTLLFLGTGTSAGVPMIAAGDEFARTQRGNNNAYCHDSALTWLSWEHESWQDDLFAHVLEPTKDDPVILLVDACNAALLVDGRGRPVPLPERRPAGRSAHATFVS